MSEIKGQQQVVKELTRIFNIFKVSEGSIRPHFFLTGPSGCGKSHTIATLCAELSIPVVEINAAQLTKEGTSGNSVSKALSSLATAASVPTVCFVDEFDKLFISGNCNSDLAHETTNGVQNEFLKILESDTASVFGDYGKYVSVSVDKVLFVFAGAFNGEEDIDLDRLRGLGLKTEFLGRVGLVYNTEPLTLDTLYSILNDSKLLNGYVELFNGSDREEAVLAIQKKIAENYEHNTLGARMITTLTHQFFIEGGFKDKSDKKVTFQKKLDMTT